MPAVVLPGPLDGVGRWDAGEDHHARDHAAGASVAGVAPDLDQLPALGVDGNPLSPNAKSLLPDGVVSDGSLGPRATGYSMIKAGSMDEAVEMPKAVP